MTTDSLENRCQEHEYQNRHKEEPAFRIARAYFESQLLTTGQLQGGTNSDEMEPSVPDFEVGLILALDDLWGLLSSESRRSVRLTSIRLRHRCGIDGLFEGWSSHLQKEET